MPDPIEIVAYRAEWPVLFQELGRSLRGALGNTAIRIDHIGSTAVPGLAAKAILDVQISVPSFEPLETYCDPLKTVGFVHRPNNPDRTQRCFRERHRNRRTHIHVRRVGSWSEQSALLFRDFLRNHPEEAKGYADVKRELAERFRLNRLAYTNGKGPFIFEWMQRANQGSQLVGWSPDPSDA